MIQFNYKNKIFLKNIQFFETKLNQLFNNIQKWLDCQLLFTKIGKSKYLYFFYFKKFYFLLNKLCNKEDIFLNLNLFYTKPEVFSKDTRYLIVSKYIKLRAKNILYYKKKEFIKKKKKLSSSTFQIFLFHIIPKSQNFIAKKNFRIEKLDWKFFHFFFPLLCPNFIKFNFYKIYKKFSTLIYINKFLSFFQNHTSLFDGIFCLTTVKNLKFILFTGTVYLFQITMKNFKNQTFCNRIQTIKESFTFFQYKKRFFKIFKIFIKSENYRFWKKINIHSFFLCPVQKESCCKQSNVLSCGHIFSLETIKKLSDDVITDIEFFLITKKLLNTRFIDCPWCEIIHEEFLSLNLILDHCFFFTLDFHFLKLNKRKIDHLEKYTPLSSERLKTLNFVKLIGNCLVERNGVNFFKDTNGYKFIVTDNYYKYFKKHKKSRI
jgi:hypothetical protein